MLAGSCLVSTDLMEELQEKACAEARLLAAAALQERRSTAAAASASGAAAAPSGNAGNMRPLLSSAMILAACAARISVRLCLPAACSR